MDPILVERAEGLIAKLPDAERRDAMQLVDLCRALPKPDAEEANRARVELGRLAELLGRRAARALAFAALARAALAELHGQPHEAARYYADCERWLTTYGA